MADERGLAPFVGAADSSVAVSAEPETFDAAFWRLARVAHRRAFRILGVAADAEDVASETMARASLRWSRLRPPADPWVSTVASRLAIDRQRKAWRTLPMPDDEASQRVLGNALVATEGKVDAAVRLDLARALAELPKRQQQVLGLSYLSGFTEYEIGDLLGCSASTVQTHKKRGLDRLRELLEEPTTTPPTQETAS